MNKNIYPLTLYYDAACPLCNLEMRNLMQRNQAGLLAFVDISDAAFNETEVAIPKSEMMRVLYARRADGEWIQGVTPIRLAYEAVGLGWATQFTTWPVFSTLANWLYPHIAQHRQGVSRLLARPIHWLAARRAMQHMQACQDGACVVHPPGTKK